MIDERNPFLRAVRLGDYPAVVQHLSNGCNVHARSLVCMRRTALMLACDQDDNIAMIYALLQSGSVVDAQDSTGVTALMIAAGGGCIGTMSLLISRGADVAKSTPNGVSALTVAVQHNYIDAARFLLERGARVVSEGSSKIESVVSPIVFARAAMLRLLFDHIRRTRSPALLADVATCTLAEVAGRSSTSAMSTESVRDITTLLFECGASPAGRMQTTHAITRRMSRGGSAINLAVWRGNVALVEQFVAVEPTCVNSRSGRSYTRAPLAQAAQANHADICRLLIRHGAKLATRVGNEDESYRTAFAHAVAHGSVDAARVLVDAGQHPNVFVTSAQRAVQVAKTNNNDQMVRMLTERLPRGEWRRAVVNVYRTLLLQRGGPVVQRLDAGGALYDVVVRAHRDDVSEK